MLDLKQCVRNINLQAAWPARREDFDTDEAYQAWRAPELQALSAIMAQMCRANPELLRTTNTEPARRADEAGAGAGEAEGGAAAGDVESMLDDEEATFGSFTFIPPDPKAYYQRALELCIDYDLEQIKHQPEDEEVSLSILSKAHVELLNECAVRWRLMSSYRSLANLEVIKYKYDRGEVPLDCITEALTGTQSIIAESALELWTLADRANLVRLYSSLFDSSMRFIHEVSRRCDEWVLVEGAEADCASHCRPSKTWPTSSRKKWSRTCR